jgi:hypothetical protein
MMDVIYTPEEMDFLVEAAEHFRQNKVGDGFHLQADNVHVDLTDAGLSELRHNVSDPERRAFISAIIAKSWPKEFSSDEAQPDPRA